MRSGFELWKTSRAGGWWRRRGGGAGLSHHASSDAASTASTMSPTMRHRFMREGCRGRTAAQALRLLTGRAHAMNRPNLYLLRAADIAARSQTFSHPWSANRRSRATRWARRPGSGAWASTWRASRRARKRFPITRTGRTRSGSTSWRAAASRASTARSTKWPRAISWRSRRPASRTRCAIRSSAS